MMNKTEWHRGHTAGKSLLLPKNKPGVWERDLESLKPNDGWPGTQGRCGEREGHAREPGACNWQKRTQKALAF
jgi:hypothetical protein